MNRDQLSSLGREKRPTVKPMETVTRPPEIGNTCLIRVRHGRDDAGTDARNRNGGGAWRSQCLCCPEARAHRPRMAAASRVFWTTCSPARSVRVRRRHAVVARQKFSPPPNAVRKFGGIALDRRGWRIGSSVDDRERDPRGRGEFSKLRCGHVAGRGTPPHHAREFRALHSGTIA